MGLSFTFSAIFSPFTRYGITAWLWSMQRITDARPTIMMLVGFME